jgi:hypothetical protein
MSLLTCPKQMLEDLRDWLDEPSAAFWSDARLMYRLHVAQQDIVRTVQMASPSCFVATYDISLVASQALYDLPLNARLGTRWIAAENRTAGTPYYYVYDVDLRRYLETESANWPWGTESSPHLTLQGDQVRVSPAPTSAISNGIRYMYAPAYGNMLQGTLTATTTTTVTLNWSTAPDYTTTFGTVDNRDDFYNGMTLFVVSGTGAGQYRTHRLHGVYANDYRVAGLHVDCHDGFRGGSDVPGDGGLPGRGGAGGGPAGSGQGEDPIQGNPDGVLRQPRPPGPLAGAHVLAGGAAGLPR